MSAIFIDGQLAHYEVIGRGKPVLFLHGWLGSWRYWVPTMQVVSSSNRTYALDLWGFGESAKSNRYTLREQVDLIYSFLDKIGIFQISVVGHGLGAIIAYELANLYPDLVNKIMAIAYPQSFDAVNSRLLLADQTALLEKLLGKSIHKDVVKNDGLKNDANATSISLQEIENLNFVQLVNSFPKTSILVYGRNDPLVRIPVIENDQQLHENTHSINFEHSNHFPMIDESSTYSRLLLEFLELSEDDSPRNLQIKEKWKRTLR